ncbi:MAG: S53 family peptidase [Patescibacteria group bacterium]
MNISIAAIALGIIFSLASPQMAQAIGGLEDFVAKPDIKSYGSVSASPKGLTPDQVKRIYRLIERVPPVSASSAASAFSTTASSTTKKTLAIITAYDNPTIEQDLAVFNGQFSLPACTKVNGCFEKHLMDPKIKANTTWALESALDVEWAHAIAPKAKILLVVAKSAKGKDLLEAIDYARGRKDVSAISMSWGGKEFPDQIHLEDHFTSKYGATFFASSGDSGTGVSWPAASPNVVSVGGTTLNLKKDGSMLSEKAWSGSGGGVSKYSIQPNFQADYVISKANGKRAVPDVAFAADPKTGFSVFSTSAGAKKSGWHVLGGTSAGAPAWAAIKMIGSNVSHESFYKAKASEKNADFFRDIVSGKNGDCTFYCSARKHYDFVTGLGTPLSTHF